VVPALKYSHQAAGAMRDEIILIGPMCSGKSSVALCLAETLSVLNYPIDRLNWYYRFKNGYNLAYGTRILRKDGFSALLEYAEEYFTLTELGIVLDEFKGGIFDFGASHSYYSDATELEKAREVLAPFKNVVLLQPSSDTQECISILSQRIRERYAENQRSPEIVDSYIAANNRFVKHKSNRILAKHVVYTNGKSIEEVAQSIVRVTSFAEATS
jgi:hypothetical protein